MRSFVRLLVCASARVVAPLVLLACTSSPPPSRPATPAPAQDAGAPTAPADTAAVPVVPTSSTPWLGVAMDQGGDIGVRVETVVRGSPAERSGIRAADRIVAIDGMRVTSPVQVSGTVAQHKVGDSIVVGLERTGTPLRISVVLTGRPTTDGMLRMHLVGAPAPAFRNVTSLSGAPDSIAALRGKVVVLDFWASWCGPCRMLAPKLSSLKDRLGAQGLAVVGITTDPAETAAVFADETGMHYPTVVDRDGETSRLYNVTALPTVVIIDKTGTVRDVVIGYNPGRVEGIARDLLEER